MTKKQLMENVQNNIDGYIMDSNIFSKKALKNYIALYEYRCCEYNQILNNYINHYNLLLDKIDKYQSNLIEAKK